MNNLNGINVPNANLSYANHDYVSLKNAKYNNVVALRAKFSICYFQGTSFTDANLQEATMLCSIFSNETNFTGANVDGLLLLASTNADGQNISQQWLREKNALNADKAITSLEELKNVINNNKLNIETAELYRNRINHIYGLLKSMRLRYQNNMVIQPDWREMLKFATTENLFLLESAYYLLDNYIINQVKKSLNTTNIDTVNRMLLQKCCPPELTFTYKRDDEDQHFDDLNIKKYQERANQLADFLVSPRCSNRFIINFIYSTGNELEIIFGKLSSKGTHSSIHFKINSTLGKKEFDALLVLLKSKNCPMDLRIDINSSIAPYQYFKIVVAVINNTIIKGLHLGFYVTNNEIALDILGYEEENFLECSNFNMSILSHTNNLSAEIIDRITRLNTKVNALGCIALLQGIHDGSHILSAIPIEIVLKVFCFTLQPEKTKEQRNIYANNILLSPVGSFFTAGQSQQEIAMLLKKYKLPDSSQGSLEKGLRNAANNNYINDLKLFIKHVTNLDAQDNKISHKTALHWAAEKGYMDCVNLLLEAGANPDIQDAKGETAQMYIQLKLKISGQI